MSARHVTPTCPIVDPRDARKGRFLIDRKHIADFRAEVGRLEAAMHNPRFSGWHLVAFYSVSSHTWQAFAVREEVASRGTEA